MFLGIMLVVSVVIVIVMGIAYMGFKNLSPTERIFLKCNRAIQIKVKSIYNGASVKSGTILTTFEIDSNKFQFKYTRSNNALVFARVSLLKLDGTASNEYYLNALDFLK